MSSCWFNLKAKTVGSNPRKNLVIRFFTLWVGSLVWWLQLVWAKRWLSILVFSHLIERLIFSKHLELDAVTHLRRRDCREMKTYLEEVKISLNHFLFLVDIFTVPGICLPGKASSSGCTGAKNDKLPLVELKLMKKVILFLLALLSTILPLENTRKLWLYLPTRWLLVDHTHLVWEVAS